MLERIFLSKKTGLALGALLALALGSRGVSAADYTVPIDFPTIGAALEEAVSRDVIYVQPGTYYESDLVLRTGIQLRGTGESPNDTVIDGEGNGRILRCSSTGSASLIHNLTFKNGRAQGETSYDQSGGAIYINQADVSIVQCVFVGNTAESNGGAIRVIQASPQILTCTFRNNIALTGGGGALDCSYDASPLVQGCDFKANLAAWGGALSCRGESAPDVVGCFFEGNRTGGAQAYGGGALAFFESTPFFDVCTFTGNDSARGGALAALPGSPIRMNHCTITGNAASVGAGIYCSDASLDLHASIVAFQNGAGITAVGDALPTISWSNIYENRAGDLIGLPAGTGTANNNISADPFFCQATDGNAPGFSVETDSPCVTDDPECGTMGAWTAGCTGDRSIQTIAQTPRVLTIAHVSAAPNPFNPSTRIHFELESEQRIRAEIFSLDGRRVHVLADQVFTAGWNELSWQGIDDGGRLAGSGLYIVRIQGEAEVKTHKITLLK